VKGPTAALLALLALSVLLAACATHPAAGGSAGAVVPPEHRVPPITLGITSDPYPTQEKRKKITGRVLVEFQINAEGGSVAPRVVEADADPLLQAAALDIVRNAKFDVSAPSYDSSGKTFYRYGVRFCIFGCGSLAPYPGYEEILVSGDNNR